MSTSFPATPFVLRTKHAHLSAVLHRTPGKRLVILCHGFGGTKTEAGRLFVQTARSLQKAGLNALRFDFWGSGDSGGEFNQFTPNTQIRDALDVLAWGRGRYQKIAFLGLSLGAAVVMSAAYQAKPRPNALLTWSSLPDFKWWKSPLGEADKVQPGNPLRPGKRFFVDRPKVDLPEAYVALDIPRLQIQGDCDFPQFRERFTAYCPKNDPLVKHLVIPGADHVFSDWEHRRQVIAESTRWLKKQLE